MHNDYSQILVLVLEGLILLVLVLILLGLVFHSLEG